MLKWRPPLDPNEDVGAVVQGPRANLLVVADAHFGCEASELAVSCVLAALGDDPPPANLSADDLASVVYTAGVEVQSGTGLADSPHPNSRTTLALALVTDDSVQWATFGDSHVLVFARGETRRLDTPRAAYLGQAFELDEIRALMSHGRVPHEGGLVLVATDGLDAVAPILSELAEAAQQSVENGYGAGMIVEDILTAALECEAADATTVAVAI
jgi:hypothetical protein